VKGGVLGLAGEFRTYLVVDEAARWRNDPTEKFDKN